MTSWLTTAIGSDGVIGQGITELSANIAGLAPVCLGVVVAVIVAKKAIKYVKSFMQPA